GIARRNNDAVSTGLDELCRSGASRRDHWQSLRHSFTDHHGETIGQGWQKQHIGQTVFLEKLCVWDCSVEFGCSRYIRDDVRREKLLAEYFHSDVAAQRRGF